MVAVRGRVPSPRLAGLAFLTVTFVVHVPTLFQPLLEVHPFRQTYTAWTARIYHEQGVDLLHPMVPVLGEPFEVPFEFPLYQALATPVMSAGIDVDAALRLTALATFLVAAVLIWRFLAHLRGEAAGLVGLAAFLFSPFGLLESRTSTMEYLAAAAAMGFVLLGLLWHERARWPWYGGAMLLGVIAMLVKPTTAALYLLPILALAIECWRDRRYPVPRAAVYGVALLLLVSVPGIVAVLWTMHADAIKSASMFTASLTTHGLQEWDFGTLGQRLDLARWARFLFRNDLVLFGAAMWAFVPLALASVVGHRRHRPFLLALLAGALMGPLVFTNLYFVHPYYVAAVSPIAAIAVGLAAAWLWDRRDGRIARPAGAALVALWLVALVATRDIWTVQFRSIWDPEQALPAARDIAAGSAPGELVVVTGRDWDPSALYYADRRGLMFVGGVEDGLARALEPEMRQRLLVLGYRTLFHCPEFDARGCTQIIDLAEAD